MVGKIDVGQGGRREFMKWIGSLTAIIGFAPLHSAAKKNGDDSGDDDEYKQLYIGVEASLTTAEVEDYLESSSEYPDGTILLEHIEQIDAASVLVPVTATTLSEAETTAAIEEDSRVRYAEWEPEIELHAVTESGSSQRLEERFEPDDPMLEEQWDVEAMNLPEVWASTTGSMDTVVSVIDTGVETDHPNLTDQFGENKGQGPEPRSSESDRDRAAHGTRSAGCAVATIDNQIGVAGTSESKLRSYNVDRIGMAEAIVSAVDDGADVITLSLGTVDGFSPVVDAVKHARENGVVFLSSAGNSGEDGVSFPANMDKTIAVGASTEWESIADFSSVGPEVDITAPGSGIPTTDLDGEHTANYRGTSAACPEAAGVVALALDIKPELTQEELLEALTETATDLGEPSDKQGAGQVDAAAFIQKIRDDDGSEKIVEAYANDDGHIDTDGLLASIEDIRKGEGDVDLLLEVIDAFRTGRSVA